MCKYYDMSINQLNLLFNSLILPLFIYGVELWGGTYHKYINQIDKFISRVLLALQQEIYSFVALFILKYIGKHIEKYRENISKNIVKTLYILQ